MGGRSSEDSQLPPGNLLAVAREYIRDYGLVRAAFRVERFVSDVLRLEFSQAIPRVWRRWTRPSVADFLVRGGRIHSTVDTFLGELFPELDWASKLPVFTEEHQAIRAEVSSRLKKSAGLYPAAFPIGPLASLAIYSAVRCSSPNTLIETGVANGASSLVLLRALDANGTGRLFSIDTSIRSGNLVCIGERSRWTFLELNRDNLRPRRALRQLLAKIGSIDFALHDSDHSYSWQSLEYHELTQKIRKGGILFSDDVNESFAFIDFCLQLGITPHFLIDESSVFGACRVPAPAVGIPDETRFRRSDRT